MPKIPKIILDRPPSVCLIFPTMNGTTSELQRARAAKGLTISALANCLGVDRQSIYNWEKGRTKPKRLARRVLAATFLVSEETVDSWFADKAA